MKKYEFRPDVAIADSAFYAYGKNVEELFKNACLATTDAMVDVKSIENKGTSGPRGKSGNGRRRH